MDKTLITISGPSGVGKTTLASLIPFLYGKKRSTIISGDSFHRWNRNSKNWKIYTHLNPKANNLKDAFKTVSELKAGYDVYLRKYNHSTGKFDKPDIELSNEIIVYEGLHALYGKDILSISDLKIYVDTQPELTKEWKVARDVSSRGYIPSDVEKEVIRRQEDQKRYIATQKDNADVVVVFEKDKFNKVNLKITRGTLPLLEETFEAFNDFLSITKELSSDISLTYGSGGNFSVKIKGQDSFFIKASGSNITDVNTHNGFVKCDRASIKIADNEIIYNNFLQKSVQQGFGRPSMETGFHASLKSRVVIHSHPIYLNAILCSKESKEIISTTFPDSVYIPYVTPGYKLHKYIDGVDKEIIFLENHGVIVSSENIMDAVKLTKDINNKCQAWLKDRRINILDYPKFDSQHLFPDSVIFPKELKIVNDFILSLIAHSGLHPKFLTDKQQKELLGLDSEKYRKTQ